MNKHYKEMTRYFHYVFLITIMALCSPCFAEGDYIVTIEYYQSNDSAVIEAIKVMEGVNNEKRKILDDDMNYADESSRRTLTSLVDIFEWYQVIQYREAFPRSSLLFSQDIVVKENQATYHGAEVNGGYLIISLDVRSKRNRILPVGIKVMYNNVNLLSARVTAHPLDKLILLHESFLEVDDDQELEMAFLMITRCPPDICIEEPEEPAESEKPVQ